MTPAYARLHVLLARDTRIALVIRHGARRSVCTLLWDREKDTFTLGQWMGGRIDVETCDLSPSGRHFIYAAKKSVPGLYSTDQWTAVSRTPYLKAVAFYPWRWGGWFLNDSEYATRGTGAPGGNRESPEVRCVAQDLPQPSLYAARLVREGWTLDRGARRLDFLRHVAAGWALWHEQKGGYVLSRGELTADTRGWDWADVDRDRLVWAAKGCLWSGVMRRDGLEQIRLLHDFNGMQFEAIEAPYEGGREVAAPPPPPASPPEARPPRRPKKPRRRKPNRSRVRPEDDL